MGTRTAVIQLQPGTVLGVIPQDYCPDVTLVLTDPSTSSSLEISAHRWVLSSWSAYFRAMFSSGMKETGSTRVEMMEDDPEMFRQLVTLMYSQSVTLDELAAMRMIRVSSRYQVPRAQDRCLQLLVFWTCPDTLAVFHGLADELSLVPLRQACVLVAQKLMESGNSFKDVPHALLELALQSDNLMLSEVSIFRVVLDWIEENKVESNFETCRSLLRHVRFENLSVKQRVVNARIRYSTAYGAIMDCVGWSVRQARGNRLQAFSPDEKEIRSQLRLRQDGRRSSKKRGRGGTGKRMIDRVEVDPFGLYVVPSLEDLNLDVLKMTLVAAGELWCLRLYLSWSSPRTTGDEYCLRVMFYPLTCLMAPVRVTLTAIVQNDQERRTRDRIFSFSGNEVGPPGAWTDLMTLQDCEGSTLKVGITADDDKGVY